MSANYNISLETQLANTLELYRGVHRDFYQAKARVEYLGAWLFKLANKMTDIKNQIRVQEQNEQLQAFNADDYRRENEGLHILDR